jgi:hypothetical protein
MHALITAAATAANGAVALGLSPWILPLVAIAAKRREDATRNAWLSRALLAWWRGRDDAQRDDHSRQVAIDERLRARIEATIWPD